MFPRFDPCPTDAITPQSCRSGSSILLDYEAYKVRAICTLVFKALAVLVAFVGTFAIKRLNQRQAVKDKHIVIPLYKISSWLSWMQVLSYAFKARKAPGGRWGFVMLFMGIYSLLADYSVGIFITEVDYAGICGFDSGVYIHDAKSYVQPVIAWTAAQIALNSQNTSYANLMALSSGGKAATPDRVSAIYSKAIYNQSFYALEQDVLGGWQCVANQNATGDLRFKNINPGQLPDQFKTRALFPKSYTASQQAVNDAGSDFYKGVAVWGVDLSSPVVSFGLATGLDTSKATNFTMSLVQCNLVETTHANFKASLHTIWQMMNMTSTLSSGWGVAIVGNFIDYGPGDTLTLGLPLLERYLNAMMMASGGGNCIRGTNAIAAKDRIIGCVTRRANVALPIWIILTFGLVVFLGLFVMDIVLLAMGQFNENWERTKGMPSDLLDWEVAFINDKVEHGKDELNAKDLKRWGYGWNESGKLQFQKTAKNVQRDSEAAAPLIREMPKLATEDSSNEIEMEMPTRYRPHFGTGTSFDSR